MYPPKKKTNYNYNFPDSYYTHHFPEPEKPGTDIMAGDPKMLLFGCLPRNGNHRVPWTFPWLERWEFFPTIWQTNMGKTVLFCWVRHRIFRAYFPYSNDEQQGGNNLVLVQIWNWSPVV